MSPLFLLGLGLGLFVLAAGGSTGRDVRGDRAEAIRDHAVAAQRAADRAAQVAREASAQWADAIARERR